jgi:hypothetical protein
LNQPLHEYSGAKAKSSIVYSLISLLSLNLASYSITFFVLTSKLNVDGCGIFSINALTFSIFSMNIPFFAETITSEN